jgi:hypothetical protein
MTTYLNGDRTELSVAGRALLDRFRTDNAEPTTDGTDRAHATIDPAVGHVATSAPTSTITEEATQRARQAVLNERIVLSSAVADFNHLLANLDIAMRRCSEGLRDVVIADHTVSVPAAATTAALTIPAPPVMHRVPTVPAAPGVVVPSFSQPVMMATNVAPTIDAVAVDAPVAPVRSTPYPTPIAGLDNALAYDTIEDSVYEPSRDTTVEMPAMVDLDTPVAAAKIPPPPQVRRAPRPNGSVQDGLPKLPAAPGAPDDERPKRRWRS